MARDPISGLALAERFYRDAVRPILDAHVPALEHSAGRLGAGSDVLGFDDETSRDHDWGPRLDLFLADAAWPQRPALLDLLAVHLPAEFLGFPTRFAEHADGTLALAASGPPARHGVAITTAARFFEDYAALDIATPPRLLDWLSIPPQRLRTIAEGALFHDALGVQRVRDQLAWYPRDVWFYLMANQWRRIDEEAPFVGRAQQVGDDLGASIVAARQAIEVMRLCFLIERRHAPYFKWFGSALARLACAPRLTPLLRGVLAAPSARDRESALAETYLALGALHNDLAVTAYVDPALSNFHERPFRVPPAARFVEALHAAIEDPAVLALPPHVGAIWQFSDSTDVLSDPTRWTSLSVIYRDERSDSSRATGTAGPPG